MWLAVVGFQYWPFFANHYYSCKTHFLRSIYKNDWFNFIKKAV